MERMNKIMVIDYTVPADDREAYNLLEYFGIPGSPDECTSRIAQTAKDFMAEPDCDNIATWFLKMFEDGRITPPEVLMYAVAGWSRPIIEMQQEKQSIVDRLIEALRDRMKD